MKCRQIRTTDQQWRAFQALGGAAWLRELLDAPSPSEYVKAQRDLINRVVADSAFLSVEQLAEKHGLSVSSIKRKL